MTDLIGTPLPQASLMKMGSSGPETVSTQDISEGKKIIIFAVPGAYTPTCTKTHLPGFVDTADALRAKGIEGIYCVTVNDVFVATAWSDEINASAAGVEVLADGSSELTKALGMDFTAPPAGLIDRSRRYAMIVDDGKIVHFEVEAEPGTCTVSSAEHLLEAL